jgi:acetyltransferase
MLKLPSFPFKRLRRSIFAADMSSSASESAELRDLWRTRSGAAVMLRAARAGDGALVQALVRGLSMESRYHRFFYPLRELGADLLARFSRGDPERELTLLALTESIGQETAVAMAQYVVREDAECADFAVVVADDWQREGIGRRLIETLICVARGVGIVRLEGEILAENRAMLRLMLRLDFALTRHPDGAYLVKASKALEAPQWKCSPLAALASGVRTGSGVSA